MLGSPVVIEDMLSVGFSEGNGPPRSTSVSAPTAEPGKKMLAALACLLGADLGLAKQDTNK